MAAEGVSVLARRVVRLTGRVKEGRPPLESEANAPRKIEEIPPELRRLLMNGLALVPAGANVIMQLAQLGVGHGVAESRVPSGSLYEHPIKRTRTTLSYVMLACFGTSEERVFLRRAVDRQHRSVYSNVADEVQYNAFDPALQLWVAACMYRGVVDSVSFLYGEQDEATRDALYQVCGRFATTLQVPVEMWPKTRAAYESYWTHAVAAIQMDSTTRDYLSNFASLGFLPLPLRAVFGPAHRFMSVGFLAPEFREALGVKWSERDQRIFVIVLRLLSSVNRVLPRVAREWPWNMVLHDARRRIATGRPLI